ncbi:MAG TPA: hypothetical protein VK622_01955 [Puia sp.]|nr:hypothetical protein [Puia sp.]
MKKILLYFFVVSLLSCSGGNAGDANSRGDSLQVRDSLLFKPIYSS